MKVCVYKFLGSFGFGIYGSKSPSVSDPAGFHKFTIALTLAFWTIYFKF